MPRDAAAAARPAAIPLLVTAGRAAEDDELDANGDGGGLTPCPRRRVWASELTRARAGEEGWRRGAMAARAAAVTLATEARWRGMVEYMVSE